MATVADSSAAVAASRVMGAASSAVMEVSMAMVVE